MSETENNNHNNEENIVKMFSKVLTGQYYDFNNNYYLFKNVTLYF